MDNQVLNKLQAIASEHCDDYLIVLSKDGDLYSASKTKCSAYGMAQMVIGDIKDSWKKSRKMENG